MSNPFIGTPEEPFHLSVGVILINEAHEILIHCYDITDNIELKRQGPDGTELGETKYYSLMTETPEHGESLLDAAERGLMEEFGATGELIHYIGTTVGHFKRPSSDILIEKTTPFFLYKITSLDESKRKPDSIESTSDLVFLDIDTVIAHLGRQHEIIDRTDFDYAPIVERVKALL